MFWGRHKEMPYQSSLIARISHESLYYFYSVSSAAVAARTYINYPLLVHVDRSEAWRTACKIKQNYSCPHKYITEGKRPKWHKQSKNVLIIFMLYLIQKHTMNSFSDPCRSAEMLFILQTTLFPASFITMSELPHALLLPSKLLPVNTPIKYAIFAIF
jgi:hypothetical protein